MYYSILVRWRPEWDGQSVVYTKSKALFELLATTYKNKYFDDFSEELKADVKAAYNAFDWQVDYAPDPIEDIDINGAIEYLESGTVKYPITVIDHTEFTPSWNW